MTQEQWDELLFNDPQWRRFLYVFRPNDRQLSRAFDNWMETGCIQPADSADLALIESESRSESQQIEHRHIEGSPAGNAGTVLGGDDPAGTEAQQ